MDAATVPLMLRLPRVDSDKPAFDFVLLRVSSNGDKTFDLKLIGTENTAFYSTKGNVATGSTRSARPLASNFMR